MTDKHTPGPWSVYRNNVKEKYGACHDNIFIKKGNDIICELFSENDANARLIAAAPDLLAVLEHIAGHADMARTCANDAGRIKSLENIINSARAAIAKARGD